MRVYAFSIFNILNFYIANFIFSNNGGRFYVVLNDYMLIIFPYNFYRILIRISIYLKDISSLISCYRSITFYYRDMCFEIWNRPTIPSKNHNFAFTISRVNLLGNFNFAIRKTTEKP